MDGDRLLQSTLEQIVATVNQAVAAEAPGAVIPMQVPGGPAVGRQVTIDATEKDGPMNRCRLSALDPGLAPAGEAVRVEYEHDKTTSSGQIRVYSIQSVRRQGGQYVLMENFLADDATTVREADFRSITSEAYAQQTVLKSLEEWVQYRAWQRQHGVS
jgi:hypothetical protein